MSPFLPSTSAVSFLPGALLALLLAAYFAVRLARGSRLPANLHLLGAMSCLVAFALASFAEYSLIQEASLVAASLESPLISLAAVFLLQFAYHFPTMWEARQKEARLALLLSGLAALWEWAYAWYRLQRLFNEGDVLWREPWSDLLQIGVFAWSMGVMIRQERRFRAEAVREACSGFSRAVWPSHRRARAARATATIFALTVLVVGLAEYQPFGLALHWRPLILSQGLLVALLFFALVYLNELPEITSVMVKLLGLGLIVVVAVLNLTVGGVAHLHRSIHASRTPGLDSASPPGIAAPQTLRFLPRAEGGYDLKRLDLRWAEVTGRPVEPKAFGEGAVPVVLDFPFRYFGREWTRTHVGREGYVSFGRDPGLAGFRAFYGLTPSIVPYLADLQLQPGLAASGVFVEVKLAEAVVTWNRMRVPGRDGECTVQLVLRRDGSFDLTHAAVPGLSPKAFGDEPGDGWLVGVISGTAAARPGQLRFAAGGDGREITVGLSGLVQDAVYQSREQASRICGPLSLLVIASVLLALALLAALFTFALVRPLNELVEAARRVNGGLFDEPARVYHQDEVGFLAQTFNAMMRQMRSARPGAKPPAVGRQAKDPGAPYQP